MTFGRYEVAPWPHPRKHRWLGVCFRRLAATQGPLTVEVMAEISRRTKRGKVGPFRWCKAGVGDAFWFDVWVRLPRA